ncbi:calcium uptake protein, mitochondrial [Carica papaya]|uniref:calcium uptake protein, mitochondrial n=1 Tax=Carica papaya TaxID=3649 RepID=UPI000B8C7187|nr:calcium uptake protein, mitochondrial [Carica papaya]
MPPVTHLKRSQPSINYLFTIQRLQTRQFSSPARPSSSSPLIQAPCFTADKQNESRLTKWISGILLGSSLGLLFWSSSSDSKSPFLISRSVLSFSDSSSHAEESIVDDPPWSNSLLRKFSLPDYSSKFIFGDAYRRKVFFNYEKRLRLRSPPEKVFEYFASVKTPEGEILMRPSDLMRAVVPVFPPSESNLVRDGYLSGERNPGDLRCDPSQFFMLFDVNNDGLISFKEYIFFVTLLSIPESSFLMAFKMFDMDNSGEIDKEEFKKVMALMRTRNRQGAVHRDGLRTGLKVNGSVDNGGLVEYFFGKDGNERLQHDKFVQFLRELRDEMLRLEFDHYDYKRQKSISVKDFALSMVASADMSHLDRLLDRADELNDRPLLRGTRITFEEFKNFAELRRKLHPFSIALFSYGKVNGLLTRKDFKRAAFHVCGLSLSDTVIDIIFHLFDANRDGNLSADEFVSVLCRREKDIAQPVGKGLFGFLRNRGNNFSISQFLP